MKKYQLAWAVAIMLLMGIAGTAMAQQGQPAPPQGPQSGEGWFCPWCGRSQDYGPGYGPGMHRGYGMGPGMHRGYGEEMGPGMHRGYGGYGSGRMHRGYGPGPGYGYRPEPYRPGQQRQFNQEEAEAMVENYLSSSRNPNLKVGKVEEKDDHYVVDIRTKDGSLVDRYMVDKNTGWMRSIY